MSTTITVNGVEHAVDADGAKPLLWVLREDLGLTGTKFGCGVGQCRACTVKVDGSSRSACTTTLAAVAGRSITTVEGLDDELADHVREAWAEAGVSQCGYCQPGQIVAAHALLSRHDDPDDEAIDSGMPNLCRCGTYPRIRAAIHAAAARRKA